MYIIGVFEIRYSHENVSSYWPLLSIWVKPSAQGLDMTKNSFHKLTMEIHNSLFRQLTWLFQLRKWIQKSGRGSVGLGCVGGEGRYHEVTPSHMIIAWCFRVSNFFFFWVSNIHWKIWLILNAAAVHVELINSLVFKSWWKI
jgi:hypothetical protein